MPVQFIGAIGTSGGSESRAPHGPVVDKVYLGAIARAHELAGFDRVLIGYFSSAPDGFQIAAYAAQQTERLQFLLAHRPGFVAPTLAARQLATLDQFIDGRLAVHIITGGSDAEQQRDGDFLGKAERYARTDDYLDVVKRTWTATEAFDHDGPFYQVRQSFAAVKPVQQPHLPVYFGGSSDEAIAVAGKHADVFALWGETLEQTAQTIARVRAAAARHGRSDQIGFSLSLRPVLARTEDEAWARADRILAAAKAQRAKAQGAYPVQLFRNDDGTVPNVGSQRLLDAAAGGRVRDKRLWTEIAALTGGSGNSTALVGTAEQVAESLLDYYDLGIDTFLIRGFDPLEDAIEYGRDLLPLVRAAVAERDMARVAAE
ncbi:MULTISPECIES: LLM class flavin-dependent oxidoreductase [unclassified Novosphingobium]|uniref:LLM class flavin-dependent oxidoreductase n=1 Tax=unclassified Novosphingobium TaxID=2644732 RepID=UPI00146B0FDB|nr:MULTISPECIES: LLM class flavin-dependent oxidoreductase [unclassified Novosphingobium]NMN07165.1 alkanesulfonate monooxygenase [Novosphingobium sp. SG919]NMN89247.1 alkanesulfonate monooxygenase [Novosphingobium sp. SG916]